MSNALSESAQITSPGVLRLRNQYILAAIAIAVTPTVFLAWLLTSSLSSALHQKAQEDCSGVLRLISTSVEEIIQER